MRKSDSHFTENYIQIATNQDVLAIPQHRSSLSFYYCHRHASMYSSGIRIINVPLCVPMAMPAILPRPSITFFASLYSVELREKSLNKYTRMLFARECDKWMIGETCYLRLNKLLAILQAPTTRTSAVCVLWECFQDMC